MGLADLVRSARAIANTQTSGLQADVTHEAWDGGSDGYGKPSLLPGVTVRALVEGKQRLIKTATGEIALSRAKITFLVAARVSVHDWFTLPDGTRGPVLEITGLVDPATGHPYIPEVWLG